MSDRKDGNYPASASVSGGTPPHAPTEEQKAKDHDDFVRWRDYGKESDSNNDDD